MNNPNSIFGSFHDSYLKGGYSRSTEEIKADSESVPLGHSAGLRGNPPRLGSRSFSHPDQIPGLAVQTSASSASPNSDILGSKRSVEDVLDPKYPRKRSRVNERPAKPPHSISFTGPVRHSDTNVPLSPLFFSHSPPLRPNLPPRFSSSEAGEKMLSKTKGEDQNVKTVTLARAPYGAGQSSRTRRSSLSRSSAERTLSPGLDSSETGERSDQPRLLNSIGITELLDQDDRPSFIVDLADSSNHNGSSPLKVLFANRALRLYEGLLDTISGNSADFSPDSKPIVQFRAWVMNWNINGETSHSSTSAFTYGSMSWTCFTLRRRFRVVNSTLLTPTSAASSAADFGGPAGLYIPRHGAHDEKLEPSRSSTSTSKDNVFEEPRSYFGDAWLHSPNARNSSLTTVASPNLNSPGSQRDHDNFETFEALPNSAGSANTAMVDAESTAATLEDAAGQLPTDFHENLEAATNQKEVGFFDWTRVPITDVLPPHIKFARTVDWGSTSLGPIETWSADLRQMCNLIMASPHPAAMYWGEDLVAIYNEAYVYLAGQKHPHLMGQSYRDAWSEIWDEVKDVFASAQKTGQATMKDDDCLFIKRSDYLEETYFSWSIIPMVGGDGSVMGLYNPAFEKTRRKIAERRMLTLREVGERTATARDLKGFWAEVLSALECNEYDTPFVLLYSLADEDTGDESSVTSSSMSGTGKQCYLEGSLGVPNGHLAAPLSMDLRTGTEGFVPVFREVLKINRPIVLDSTYSELPQHLLEGLEWRGFGDPAKSVVCAPIHPTTCESTLGFLIMGVNPRRPYDDDYSLFIQLLSRQLATSLASVVLFEEEIKRGQRAAKLAALDRIELSEQLAARTQEAIESETKFTRMAEFAPVGMFIANSEGRIIYCNDTWYEIARIPKDAHSTDRWMDYVVSEDKHLVTQLWSDLVIDTKLATSEFRFKAPWTDRNGVQGPTWVLFSGYPERNETGSLKSVFGSITNISQQKWAEDLQKKKMEEAVELKRQQENFIDITSHEMRNPLSAILQCADEMMESLLQARSQISEGEDTSVFDNNVDAAQTILLCAQHQKRIVDDVLTLSKLDSALLQVTPVNVQPKAVVQRALKMFESELQSADIKMEFNVDKSFRTLNVDWVRCDPSRVMQVLINLTTNAIKFTTSEKKRKITVTVAASLQRPSAHEKNVVNYIPIRSRYEESTEGVDWGDGEEIFIQFSVQDTGKGLSESERKSLFMRFSQASPRTHVQYGGSGLGLFISRELTEMQGGQIGVESIAGGGSTFAFYIKARRTTAPIDIQDQVPFSSGIRRTSDGKSSYQKSTTPDKNGKDASTEDEGGPLKILIVEDNLVNQRVLKKQLINAGCDVHLANHGGEALDKLRESNFWVENNSASKIDLEVILMDQEMPVMDGITCTKKIRELEKEGKLIGHVPIIAVTANARSEQIKTALEAGMDDVVSKPFRIPELIPKVQELRIKHRVLWNSGG